MDTVCIDIDFHSQWNNQQEVTSLPITITSGHSLALDKCFLPHQPSQISVPVATSSETVNLALSKSNEKARQSFSLETLL